MKLITTKDYFLLIDEEAEKQFNNYVNNIDNSGISRITALKSAYIQLINVATGVEGAIGYYQQSEVEKIIGYYPLTKEAKELDLPLLPNPFEEKVDIIIQARNFNKQVKNPHSNYDKEYQVWERAYIEGFDDGLTQSDKQFSLDDMFSFAIFCCDKHVLDDSDKDNIKWVSAFSKRPHLTNQQMFDNWQSPSTQQLPKEFIPEYNKCTGMCMIVAHDHKGEDEESCFLTCCRRAELQTITNSEGKEELVGTYKY